MEEGLVGPFIIYAQTRTSELSTAIKDADHHNIIYNRPAAHFPSRPEFAFFTSSSYRFQEDRRQQLLCVSNVHPAIVPSPTFTIWIFSRNYHNDLGQRTAQAFRIRIPATLTAPCRTRLGMTS